MIRRARPVNRRRSGRATWLAGPLGKQLARIGLPDPRAGAVRMGHVDPMNFQARDLGIVPDLLPARRAFRLSRLQRPLEAQAHEALVTRERLRDMPGVVVADNEKIDMFVGLVGRIVELCAGADGPPCRRASSSR
jgi:hypothetical protein